MRDDYASQNYIEPLVNRTKLSSNNVCQLPASCLIIYLSGSRVNHCSSGGTGASAQECSSNQTPSDKSPHRWRGGSCRGGRPRGDKYPEDSRPHSGVLENHLVAVSIDSKLTKVEAASSTPLLRRRNTYPSFTKSKSSLNSSAPVTTGSHLISAKEG